jgi:hypothetical protein
MLIERIMLAAIVIVLAGVAIVVVFKFPGFS